MSNFWKHIVGMGIYTAACLTGYHYHLASSNQLTNKNSGWSDETRRIEKKEKATFSNVKDSKLNYDLHYISSKVVSYPDFPKPNIVFRDIFPALRDPRAFEMITSRFCNYLQSTYGAHNIDAIVGLDSRGFLFGPMIAMRLGVPFVPVRKQGKLPGECAHAGYEKEYGKDTLEVQKTSLQSGDNVVIVDDLLATGGTLQAANDLMKHIGCNVLENMVVIELDSLKGRDVLKPIPVFALLHYED